MRNILITGGAGFIGSALVRHLFAIGNYRIFNLDALTYAGNLENITSDIAKSDRYSFMHGSISDRDLVLKLLFENNISAVMHLAAESHVDRSISDPEAFVSTNVLGTAATLEACRHYWETLSGTKQAAFRFVHVSTDEVFGSLGASGLFSETTPYAPNSPYSASKAASDHLVKSWSHTYGMPCIVTNCSNNYGPCQFPEKFIPLVLSNAVKGLPLPVYGDGQQVRDWLHVDDHVRALLCILDHGLVGHSYCIGGDNERTNLEVVTEICTILDETVGRPTSRQPHKGLIEFVNDRPGHDRRYAIDASKIKMHTGWRPREQFHTGLRNTVAWYQQNSGWIERIIDGSYRQDRASL
jgi:dTDP-glucose 4,6-dehydratase